MRRRGISALVASHRALRACANAGMLSREPYCRRRSAPTMAAQPRELGGGAAGAMPADRGGLRQRRVNQVAPPRVPSPAAYPPAAAAVDAGVGARPRWRRRLCEWVVLLAAFAAVDAGLRHAMSDPSSFPEHFKALRPEYNGTIDVVDVAELERGGAAGFYRNVVALAKPVLIRGAAARWPAFDKWSNAYLRERHGEKRVPVDVAADRVFHRAAAARGYMIRPDVQMMPLATYVDALEVGGWVDAAAFAPPGGSSSARASESGAARLHLALEEVEMADHVPDMLDDIAVPEWAGFLTVQHRNLWMAAEDKVSKLHFDNYENLLALVAGRKRLTLFSPFDTPFLYPSEWPEFRQKFGSDGTVELEDMGTMTANFSPVDINDPDLSRYPEFVHARPVHVELEAGDMLYLPAAWWHQVVSSTDGEGRCLAVNLWFNPHSAAAEAYFSILLEDLSDDSAVVAHDNSPRKLLSEAATAVAAAVDDALKPAKGRRRYAGAT